MSSPTPGQDPSTSAGTPSLGKGFPRPYRLSGKLAFAAVYAGKYRQTRGPLLMYSIANALAHGRLGLSVGRKVGTAPQRNRIKRLLRDAFRTTPSLRDVPVDWLIVVRPHQAMSLQNYQSTLGTLVPPQPREG